MRVEGLSARRSTGVRAWREYTLRVNRRTFLAAPLIPLIPKLAFAQGLSPTVPSTFDPWIEIHAANLRHNAGEVARVTTRPVLAVIKNNGYGLGVVQFGERARAASVRPRLRRGETPRGARLRDAGIKKPILLMAPFDERDLQLAVVARHHADGLHADRRRARARKPAARAAPFRSMSASTPASAASACRIWKQSQLIRDLASRKGDHASRAR